MTFLERMKAKAKQKQKVLVLPEGYEPRTLTAAARIAADKLASKVFLLGDPQSIQQTARNNSVDISDCEIINPDDNSFLEAYSKEYHELRKHKGISHEDALQKIKDPLHFGAMMVRLGDADALVAGADNPTGNVLVPSFTIIKTAPGTKYASSCFVMYMENSSWGVDGHMIFSDCATIPDPDENQLAEIASAAAKSCRIFLEAEPVVAMLSFSTKGSAEHQASRKVINAFEIIREKEPELKIDGELQADAALVESVAKKKAPSSGVAGKANTLVFPDLSSGNIGYKLVQRLAGAQAYGPFLQGFAKPVSDLSRGCSVEDVINTAAATLAQCE